MTFDLDRSTRILARTPAVLDAFLRDLPPEWTHKNEGPDTWSPYDVVGYLVHGERTDWMVRARIILSGAGERRFEPFDRTAHLARDTGEPLSSRLDEFATLRAANLEALAALGLTERDMEKTGVHPDFGTVTLGQLLATGSSTTSITSCRFPE
jgi:hypothetical protein